MGECVMPSVIVVKAIYDPDACVWYTESNDVQGLHIEGATIEDLIKRLPDAICDLLEAAEDLSNRAIAREVPIELIAHASTRVRVGCAQVL